MPCCLDLYILGNSEIGAPYVDPIDVGLNFD